LKFLSAKRNAQIESRSRSQSQPPAIDRYARRTLVLFFLANLTNFYDRQIVSALAEAIKVEFTLTDVQVGGLNSAFELTYPLAAVVLAMIADRWGRRRIVTLAVAIWSVATALTGAAGSYLALILARLGVGIGQGGYGPPAVATLTKIFPDAYRARAVSIHEVGVMVGSAAGYLLGGLIAEVLGWRVPFLAGGFLGLLLAWAIGRLSARESLSPPPPPSGPVSAVPHMAASTARQLLAVPTLRLIYGSGVLFYLSLGGLVFWLPTFMQRFHGYTLVAAAAVGGAVQVVMGVAGVLAGGWLGDRLTQRHAGGRLLTMGLGLATGTPLAILAMVTSSHVLFLASAALALFFYALSFPCIGPQINDVTPFHLKATAQAFYLLLTHYLGSLPAAPLIGWLSDGGRDLRGGMVAMPGLSLVAALMLLWGGREMGRGDRVGSG